MSVRAKFKVQRKETSLMTVRNPETGEYEQKEGTTVHLSPVTSGSKENEEFFYFTPGGQIQLGTINEDAAAQFALGTEFYVDFSTVPAPEPVGAEF